MSDTPTPQNATPTQPPTPPRAAAGAPPATLANVNLFVRDPERSRRFYVEALGLRDDARSAPPHFVLLDAGGGRVGGCTLTLQAADVMNESVDRAATGGGVELGFELVADGADAGRRLDDVAARVTAAGGTAHPPQVMGWARGFDGHDPDGHRLTVFVRSAEGQPPGNPDAA